MTILKSSFLVAVLSAAVCVAIPCGYAQERSAMGSLNTEMSWSALKSLIDQAMKTAEVASITADDARSRADEAQLTANDALVRAKKIEACGIKGMIYAPGAAGVDSAGCLAPQNGTLSGTTYTSSGTKSYTFSKTSGMDVQVDCSSTGTANSTSRGSGRASVSVLGRIKLASGWVKMFEDSDSCHVYSDSGSCNVSASGSYKFYEKGGVLYRYSGALNMANGVAVMGSTKFTNLSNWTGTLEVTGKSCSVAIGR